MKKKLAVLIKNQKQWDAITKKFEIKWVHSDYSSAIKDDIGDHKLCVRISKWEHYPKEGYASKEFYLSEKFDVISFSKAIKLKQPLLASNEKHSD